MVVMVDTSPKVVYHQHQHDDDDDKRDDIGYDEGNEDDGDDDYYHHCDVIVKGKRVDRAPQAVVAASLCLTLALLLSSSAPL